MNLLAPQIIIGHPLGLRKAQHRLDLRAGVDRTAVRIERGHIGDRRQLLDQCAKALLSSAVRRLGLLAFSDIRDDHHAPVDVTSAVDQRGGGDTDIDP